jgi:hypothetical protein
MVGTTSDWEDELGRWLARDATLPAPPLALNVIIWLQCRHGGGLARWSIEADYPIRGHQTEQKCSLPPNSRRWGLLAFVAIAALYGLR